MSLTPSLPHVIYNPARTILPAKDVSVEKTTDPALCLLETLPTSPPHLPSILGSLLPCPVK